MTDQLPTTDLIEQLRAQAVLVAQGHGGTAESQSMLAAADEIERLLRNTGCARHQRTTQFCAEVVEARRSGWNEACEAAYRLIRDTCVSEYGDEDPKKLAIAIRAMMKEV